jgi:hypothetical protein
MAPPRTMRLAGRADGPLTAVSPADHLAPVAATSRARLEAAAAIAICATCPVRGHCLTLSLRHWDIGQHGVWGGLIAADRALLRHRAPAGRTAGRGLSVVGGYDT